MDWGLWGNYWELRLKEMKSRLSALQDRVKDLTLADIRVAREGNDTEEIHRELSEIRAEIKTLKRTITRKENRSEADYLEATIAVNVSRDIRDRLESLAAAKAMTLSQYLRWIIDEHMAAQAVNFHGGLTPMKNRGKVGDGP